MPAAISSLPSTPSWLGAWLSTWTPVPYFTYTD